MLCEMRGYDGSMSAWNGSHGSADSSRGLCVFRKTEFGAYVVNSNQANSHSSYHHGETDSDKVSAHYESRPQRYNPDSSRRHELRASKMYGSQHLEHQKRRSVLQESHQPNSGGTSNHQFAMAEKYSGSHPQLSNASDNRRISAPQEMEANRSTDGSVTRNIFQGPIVRVQVPELYYEDGSGKGPEMAVAYKHNMSHNKDHEQTGEHLQRARDMDGIHGSPVSETYRRINEWLKNCQQHSSTSSKSSHVSHASNHSRTENKQKSTSDNVSKSDYRKHNQTGNFSNSKPKPNEPRFAASLEPKTAKAGIVVLQTNNHQHKQRNTDWTEKREVPFRLENQSSAPRNNDVITTGAFSSKFTHAVNTTKPFYESGGVSKTSSEWSSETLSINGSDDKSSYCTDFTPFELDPADSFSAKNQMSTTPSECPPSVAKNIRISQVMIDDRMQRKSVAHTKKFPEALHDPIRNEFTSDRRNGKSNFNSGWTTNVGQKSKQDRLTDRTANNPTTDFGASLQTSKTGRVVTVFIGDAQRTQLGNAQFDNNHIKQSIGVQNNGRYQKAMADPVTSSAEDPTLNSKIFDRRVFNGDRKSVQVPIETRLYTSDRKPLMPLRCTSLEHPLSSRYFTDRGGDQHFSIRPGDVVGYKESSRDEDSALRKQLESRPVAQLRSGSLSITIRPNRLTVMDYFKTIDDVWDSSGRKEERELKGNVERSSYFESRQRIDDDKATNDVALDINDGIECLNSGLGDDVSDDESEELDEFTKAVIKADISGKVLQSSSNTEYPSKPQYNVLKQSTNLRPNTSALLGDVHSRFSGKIYQTIDDKHNESEDEKNRDLKEPAMFEGDIPQNSISSLRTSQGLPQEGRSSIGWIPGKSANSLDRDLQLKFNKNNGLVDDSFGHDAEYLKCKHEDIIETDFRSNSEKKHSGKYLLVSEGVTKNSCPEFQSFVKNHSDSNKIISGDIARPNSFTNRMALVSDEHYTDDRNHMETASPRSMSSASKVVTDGFNNHLELENVQCSEAKATANKPYEEDRFLMSLLKGRTPDLPAYESICTPRLQSQNLVRTSDFTMQSNCGSDAEEDMPFRTCSDQFDKTAASVMKSPTTFEGSQLLDEEPGSLDFNLSTYRVYESPKESGKDHSEEFYQKNSQETEYTGKLFNESSPDSLLAVFVEGAATTLAEIPRCQSKTLDVTHLEEGGEQQDNNGCYKTSEDYPDASFIINNTMKNSEPMYCQELIDFPENLVIDPPESFSDFTIML